MINLNNPSNDTVIREQFSRERELDTICDLYGAYIVIGLGGIGSHVTDILGSVQSISDLVLIDSDDVEISSLNRTAYRYEHVGKLKVEAMAEMISSRNYAVDVHPIARRFDSELVDDILSDNSSLGFLSQCATIIDCRDNYYGDYDLMEKLNSKNIIVRAAYNGMSVTIDLNPKKHPVWGQGGYTENTSHSIPARLAALIAVSAIDKYSYYNDFHPEMLDTPITFEVGDLFNLLSFGCQVKTLDISDIENIGSSIEKKTGSVHPFIQHLL